VGDVIGSVRMRKPAPLSAFWVVNTACSAAVKPAQVFVSPRYRSVRDRSGS
jgi:hypothetical protein